MSHKFATACIASRGPCATGSDLDFEALKGQSLQDLELLENPMKVLVLIGHPVVVACPRLHAGVLVTKVVYNCCGYGRVGKK